MTGFAKPGRSGPLWPEPHRVGLAMAMAIESVLRVWPSRSPEEKRNEAMCVALGILHGTMGPDKPNVKKEDGA